MVRDEADSDVSRTQPCLQSQKSVVLEISSGPSHEMNQVNEWLRAKSETAEIRKVKRIGQ